MEEGSVLQHREKRRVLVPLEPEEAERLEYGAPEVPLFRAKIRRKYLMHPLILSESAMVYGCFLRVLPVLQVVGVVPAGEVVCVVDRVACTVGSCRGHCCVR